MQTPGSSSACTHTFTDRHIHGIAGVDFATSPTADITAALQFLRRRRTTRVTASLPTLPVSFMSPVLQRLTPLCHRGLLDGVHLEGPFLAPTRAGAHPRDAILAPNTPDGRHLLALLLDHQATEPVLTMMTVAPELPGFDTLVPLLVEHNIAPALGHTDATYQQMSSGITTVLELTGQPVVITHCYNAMRGFHHRDPGPLLAIEQAAARGEVIVELIADGHHVDFEIIRWWFETHPTAVRLVSDASAATLPAGVSPLTAQAPRLGTQHLGYPLQAGPLLPDGQTLASGAADLLAIHDALVARGMDHAAVCAAMRGI